MKNTLLLSLFLILMLKTFQSESAPWVEADDIHLRADIQRLADEGIITVPVNTFPLMWSGILSDLESAKVSSLSGATKAAFLRVKNRAHWDSKPDNGRFLVEVGYADEAPRFQHFSSPLREKASAKLSYEQTGERFSGRIAATKVNNPQDGDELRFDDSYLSAVWGNWAFTAGYLQTWWGPGWDTALISSTNARPVPSFTITRSHPEAFESRWLSWIGPWTLTTGIGVLDDERDVDDALLWTFRATLKPLKQLEIGLARVAQICGDDRPCNLDVWRNMLIGDDNPKTAEARTSEPGNQVASIDVRWGSSINGIPYGLYWETAGEDKFRLDNFPPFNAKSHLYGADITLNIGKSTIRTFLERSDTLVWCNGEFSCALEHHVYTTGYRYRGRSLGSTYDNDAKTYTLGLIGFLGNGNYWKANLRYLDLNKDNVQRGNTVAPIAEKNTQLDFSYLFPLFNGRMEVGGQAVQRRFEMTQDDETDINAWFKWSYVF